MSETTSDIAATSPHSEDSQLPFLTHDIPGIGGIIKQSWEDFVVEELPLYPPSGEGDHTYVLIEKRGMATLDAIDEIGRSLGYPRKQIGYAGLKDARAVTRQWISFEHMTEERVRQLHIPHIEILEVARHNNKLKLGHLAANRFTIRIRKINQPLKQVHHQIEDMLSLLSKRGVPNYFGPQRFGNRNDGHLLGLAIVKGEMEKFVDLFLGYPCSADRSQILVARTYYEQGHYEKALESWPRGHHDHLRALKAMIQSKGNKKRAYNAVDQHMKRFFISAFQSDLFNKVLAARMPNVDQLLLGDMAYKHDNGACFRVDDAVIEQPRCEAFDISPTGPLYGYRMTELTGPAGDIENPILEASGLTKENFRQMGYYKIRGGRRPIRFQPRHCQVNHGTDGSSPYIEVRFELDSGCYATTVLREIMKANVA